MARWNIITKLKKQEETQTEVKPIFHQKEKTINNKREPKVPLTEYNETLYSMDTSNKKSLKPGQKTKKDIKRTSWESPRTIEQRIDSMGKIHPDDEVDKKVDRVLTKKKNEGK